MCSLVTAALLLISLELGCFKARFYYSEFAVLIISTRVLAAYKRLHNGWCFSYDLCLVMSDKYENIEHLPYTIYV
jgi:hypothetical protein